nr:hypothetical protein [Tanacetum cinerariifolium]
MHLALNSDGAAAIFDQALGDVEAHTRALDVGPDLHLGQAVGVAVFHGVAEQVVDNAAQIARRKRYQQGVAQGQGNALDVGNRGLEVVASRVDERVQVHVGARELRIRRIQFLVGGCQLLVDGGQFFIQRLHLLAGEYLLGHVETRIEHAHYLALPIPKRQKPRVVVAPLHLPGAAKICPGLGLGYLQGFTGLVDVVQGLKKALPVELRQAHAHGEAGNLALGKEPLALGVDQLDHGLLGHPRALLHAGFQFLIKLLDLLAGQHLLRDVNGRRQHARTLPLAVVARLIGDVKVPLVRLPGPAQGNELLLQIVGLARAPDGAEYFLKPLAGQLGQGRKVRLPRYLRQGPVPELRHARVGKLDNVGGALQQADGHGRLLKHGVERRLPGFGSGQSGLLAGLARAQRLLGVAAPLVLRVGEDDEQPLPEALGRDAEIGIKAIGLVVELELPRLLAQPAAAMKLPGPVGVGGGKLLPVGGAGLDRPPRHTLGGRVEVGQRQVGERAAGIDHGSVVDDPHRQQIQQGHESRAAGSAAGRAAAHLRAGPGRHQCLSGRGVPDRVCQPAAGRHHRASAGAAARASAGGVYAAPAPRGPASRARRGAAHRRAVCGPGVAHHGGAQWAAGAGAAGSAAGGFASARAARPAGAPAARPDAGLGDPLPADHRASRRGEPTATARGNHACKPSGAGRQRVPRPGPAAGGGSGPADRGRGRVYSGPAAVRRLRLPAPARWAAAPAGRAGLRGGRNGESAGPQAGRCPASRHAGRGAAPGPGARKRVPAVRAGPGRHLPAARARPPHRIPQPRLPGPVSGPGHNGRIGARKGLAESAPAASAAAAAARAAARPRRGRRGGARSPQNAALRGVQPAQQCRQVPRPRPPGPGAAARPLHPRPAGAGRAGQWPGTDGSAAGGALRPVSPPAHARRRLGRGPVYGQAPGRKRGRHHHGAKPAGSGHHLYRVVAHVTSILFPLAG